MENYEITAWDCVSLRLFKKAKYVSEDTNEWVARAFDRAGISIGINMYLHDDAPVYSE